MAKQGRRDSQPFINVAGDGNTVDALTRSMSSIMKGPSPDTHTLVFGSPPSGRQNFLGISLGNQQNIPGSHPSGTIGSLNQETSRRPSQGETGRQAGNRIQGLGSGSLHDSWQDYAALTWTTIPIANPGPPVVTNILSSQHSPRIVPSLGPIPPAYSHDDLQTESVSTAGGGLILSQISETVALSPSGSSHPDRNCIVPTRSFPDPFPLSHHCIDQDVHGPVTPFGFDYPQQQKIHSPGNLDPLKRGGLVPPPPPPPLPPLPPPPPPPPPPIALQPCSVSQTPQTPSYSQDYAHVPGIKAPALNSNDLARKFAHDALLASAGAEVS